MTPITSEDKETRLLSEAMQEAAKARLELSESSYIRKDEQRANAYEAGFAIGYRAAGRAALEQNEALQRENAELRGKLMPREEKESMYGIRRIEE